MTAFGTWLTSLATAWVSVLTLMRAPSLLAQEPHVSSNAPQDQPVSASTNEQERRMEAAVSPYVAQARSTCPAARARYLAGLRRGRAFSSP